MEKVKVFQIGLGSFGRHGFEKLIELQKHYHKAEVELVGVCDPDFDRLEAAKKFAESQKIDVELFTSVEETYKSAEKTNSEDSKIMIYDAGPSDLHAEHIYRSLRNNFFHLAEKPPSMTRQDHIKEKKLMLDNDVRFTVDFIERENPVVKKASKILEDEEIESIEIFREDTQGLQKIIAPVEHAALKGGAVLDGMCHEAYIMDLIDTSLEVENVEKKFYMPFEENSDSFMTIKSGKTSKISENVAEGQCTAELNGDIPVTMHSSWLGCSKRCAELGREIEEKTEHNPVNREFQSINSQGLIDEEASFFIIKGSRDLFGDLLNNRIFDLETGEEIETPNLLHDQLYRTLESSINCAVGLENNNLTETQLDSFMNLIFDISEHYENMDEFEALKASDERISNLTVENTFETAAEKN